MNEFEQLIEDYLNGDLAAEDVPRLRQWLNADQRHLQQFIRATHQHGTLRDALSGSAQLERYAEPHDAHEHLPLANFYRFFHRPTPFSITVAALVIGLLVTAMAFMAPPFYRAMVKNKEQPADPSRIVAEVTEHYDAVWADVQGDTNHRRFLTPSAAIKLESGVIEITYRDGAKVLLEAPCDYVVEDLGRGQLNRGRLLASVAGPAVGFRITTPSAEFTDLGTEFGVEVDAQGSSELVVLQGKVACRRLRSGDAPADVREVVAGQSAVVNYASLAVKRGDAVPLTSKWLDFKEQVARLDRVDQLPLFAYWPLDGAVGNGAAGKTVRDATPRDFHGTLRGATWSSAGKHAGAVRFAGGDDLVDVSAHAQQFGDLRRGAIAFWFRSTAQHRCGLFHYGRAGSTNRLVVEMGGRVPGRLRFVIRQQDLNLIELDTEATFNDGRWHHCVVSQNGITAALVVDGKPITRFTTQINSDAWLDDVSDADELWLGRDDFPNALGPMPSFDGLLDDVAVFYRPLSSAQIETIYRSGIAGSKDRDATGDLPPGGKQP